MAILPVSGTGLSLTGITGSHAADTPEKLKDAA